MHRVVVSALILLVLSVFLVWRIGSIYVASNHASDVGIIISETTAYRGSRGNLVTISLENPNTPVRGMQIELCDADNYLSCSGCDIADRLHGFTCISYEKPNGCYELVVFSFSQLIDKGTGPVLSFMCDASAQAPGGECRQLFVGRLEIADENKQPLSTSVEPGRICFDDCAVAADCGADLWCYESSLCVDGACRAVEKCPDDGLYCNGREYCDEAAKQCKRSPEPCAYCYENGCRCNEEKNVCERRESSTGDSI